MKDKFFVIDLHRVTGITAALEPDHNIGMLSQYVNDFSFTLIAPL